MFVSPLNKRSKWRNLAGPINFIGIDFLAKERRELVEKGVALVTVFLFLRWEGPDAGEVESSHEQAADKAGCFRGFTGGLGQFQCGPLAGGHFGSVDLGIGCLDPRCIAGTELWWCQLAHSMLLLIKYFKVSRFALLKLPNQ